MGGWKYIPHDSCLQYRDNKIYQNPNLNWNLNPNQNPTSHIFHFRLPMHG